MVAGVHTDASDKDAAREVISIRRLATLGAYSISGRVVRGGSRRWSSSERAPKGEHAYRDHASPQRRQLLRELLLVDPRAAAVGDDDLAADHHGVHDRS